MNDFIQRKNYWVYGVVFAFLMASLGCTYKPAYLQKSEKTSTAKRWKVKAIDPRRMSADEAAVFAKMGQPQYIRFYRELDSKRDGVYEWIYTEPVRLVYFRNGKQLNNVVMDEDLSPWTFHQKKMWKWTGIGAGIAGGLAVLIYYFTKK